MTRSRSASPQSNSKGKSNKRFGLQSIFGVFNSSGKENSPDSESIQFNQVFHDDDSNAILEEPLMNDFSSMKKRRMSAQGHLDRSSVPRTASLTNTIGGVYKAYYDNIQANNDDLNNDVERRLSTVYNDRIKKNSVSVASSEVIVQGTRDASPLDADLPTSNAPLTEEPLAQDLDLVYTGGDKSPFIIEHEFTPLYEDNDGNLVRPPFINIDPRERYHLLQLKKSVEAAEALQARIKYMVDPNETKSEQRPNSRMVDSSTQTHDINYLNKKLTFGKKRLAIEPPASPSRKRRKGVFLGDFEYDVDKIEDPAPKPKLEGYLATVSKPGFKEGEASKPEGQHNKMSQKSTNHRSGLEASLLANTKLNVTLDSSYVKKSQDIIKLKDDLQTTKSVDAANGPSTGFKFNINKSEIGGIIGSHESAEKADNKRKRSLDDSEGATKEAPKFAFGKSETKEAPKFSLGNSETKEAPKFSFGKSEEPKEAPKFSFGKSDEPKEAPKFSFGKSEEPKEAPKFSFGKSEEPKEAPKFSLGKSEKPKETPKFSFGKSEEPKEAPKFSFGAKLEEPKDAPKEAPKFSFGAKLEEPKEASKAPTFSFGAKLEEPKEPPKEAPKFSFGSKVEEPKEAPKETPKETPTFSFGAKSEEPKETPKFTFGAKAEDSKSTDAPKFTFGATSEAAKNGLNQEQKETPKFSFGKPEESKEAPKFSFGAKPEETKEAPKFSFGAKPEEPKEAPKFSFGAKPEEPKEAPKFSFGAKPEEPKEAPKFSFGTSTSTTPTPGFTFSGAAPQSTPQTTESSNFSFGKTEKPAFSFGKQGENASDPPAKRAHGSETNSMFGGDAPKPAFLFGSTPASAPSFGGSAPKPAFGENKGTGFGASGSNTPVPGSTFGKSTTPVPGIPTSTFNFAAPGSNSTSRSVTPFALQPQNNFGGAAPSFGGAPAPGFGGALGSSGQGFGSAPGFGGSTPGFQFGGAQNQPPAQFGGMNSMGGGMSNGFGAPSAPSFNFTGAPSSKEGTPDPATIFGASAPMQGGNAGFGNAPTPPVRRILHPRRRR